MSLWRFSKELFAEFSPMQAKEKTPLKIIFLFIFIYLHRLIMKTLRGKDNIIFNKTNLFSNIFLIHVKLGGSSSSKYQYAR